MEIDMAKASGGTRNYAGAQGTLAKRREEFDSLMKGGYDAARSYFDASGGFVATHGEHERADGVEDRSEVAARLLAEKGYKVYLDSELAVLEGVKHPDGRVYDYQMDIKTINKAGENSIRGAIERGVKQLRNHDKAANGGERRKRAVVLYQNTPDMDRSYVVSQLDKFVNRSSSEFRNSLDLVIVVGSNGRVHRHYLDK